MKEFAKKYQPHEIEIKWQKFWQDEKIFEFDINKEGKIYSVDTPPPTMSGKMHIGHFGSYAQQDFIVRYKRQKGFNVLFPFGTDDNGLPTEKLVEKEKKISSAHMPRADFIKKCNEYINENRNEFTNDWINAGISCDFNSSYSTISPYCQKQSQLSFIELYNKNLIYQKEAPAVWCPKCTTAIAQAEMNDIQKESKFNNIIFKVENQENLIIGTTRPELLFACVTLFVNPKDKRYKKYIGLEAEIPLFKRKIKIMADESAQMDKGTGVLMICTFGDYSDVEAVQKHNLEPIDAITKDGKLTENAKEFANLKVNEGREKILEKLKKENLLVDQKNIIHNTNVHERCGTPIEFYTHKQWFISVKKNKKKLIDAGEKINWYPEYMKKRYNSWVNGLQWDWCISRQRHFGVPFPIWYSKKTGEIILPDIDQLPVDPQKDFPNKLPKNHTKNDIEYEKDVFDTWMTSSVTPLIISKYKEDNKFFNSVYENSMRPQAHDIIRTWAFYTIVKSLYQTNKIPWKNIVISGHVLDSKGEKMSKSKGNVILPQNTISKFSSDSLRYWTASVSLGNDIRYREEEIKLGSKVVVKLWNASKFTHMMLEDYKDKTTVLTSIDKWLITKFKKTLKEYEKAFDNYDFNKAKMIIEKFFMVYYCDYYLEIVKERLYKPEIHGLKKKQAAQFTIYRVLNGILKLFAPFIPHITEEIYSYYYKEIENEKSIHISKWPKLNEGFINEEDELSGDLLIEALSGVRKFKTENKLSLNTQIKSIII